MTCCVTDSASLDGPKCVCHVLYVLYLVVFSVGCLGSHRAGINNPNPEPGIPQNLRTCIQGDPALVLLSSLRQSCVCVDCEIVLLCVSEISNQCLPLPCYKNGYERCVDGQGSFTCECKAGWRGQRCEQGELRFIILTTKGFHDHYTALRLNKTNDESREFN